jgi:ATP-binding cassette subfamily C protein
MRTTGALNYLRTHTRIDRTTVALLTTWSVVEAVPVLLSGWLIARAVDYGFLAHDTALGLGLLALYGLLEIGRAFAERQLMPVMAEVVEPIRDSMVVSVVNGAVTKSVSEPGSHSSEPDAAVVARLTGHVEVARNLISALLRMSRPVCISVLSALIGLATVAPQLLPVVLAPLALAALIYPLSWRSANRRRNAAVLAEEQVAAVTGRIVSNIRDVIATGGSARATADVTAATLAEVRTRNALTRLVGLRVAIDTLGGRLPLICTLLIAPALIRHHTLTPGQLLGAITYLTRYLIPAVSSFNGVLSAYTTQLAAVLQRLQQTAPATPTALPGITRTTAGTQETIPMVRLSEVDFSYGTAGSPVLQNLSLTIPPGEHWAIVGSSGTGKSTLGSILAGVDRPARGIALIGNRPAHDAWAAGETALIPQASYLIADTLRANLNYLNPAATAELLDHAVTELAMSDLVDRLGGYDAQLRPTELSRGEQQLIVLARTYISPASLIVLDEATSNLDPQHELQAEQAFVRRPGTLVIIAHRISSAARAQTVLLLGAGTQVMGSHEELLARSRPYACLVTASADRPHEAAPVT